MSTRGLLCLLLYLGLVGPIVRESPHYLYVSVPGSDLDRSNGGVSLLVFDVNRDHEFVKRVPIWPRAETTERVRGLRLAPSATNTRAPGKPLLYISTTRRLGAVDLASGKVRWENGYRGHTDRRTRNGRTERAHDRVRDAVDCSSRRPHRQDG
jgi:hypothetical protein